MATSTIGQSPIRHPFCQQTWPQNSFGLSGHTTRNVLHETPILISLHHSRPREVARGSYKTDRQITTRSTSRKGGRGPSRCGGGRKPTSTPPSLAPRGTSPTPRFPKASSPSEPGQGGANTKRGRAHRPRAIGPNTSPTQSPQKETLTTLPCLPPRRAPFIRI